MDKNKVQTNEQWKAHFPTNHPPIVSASEWEAAHPSPPRDRFPE